MNYNPQPITGITREWLNLAGIPQPVSLIKHLCHTGVIQPTANGNYSMDDIANGIQHLRPHQLQSLNKEFKSPENTPTYAIKATATWKKWVTNGRKGHWEEFNNIRGTIQGDTFTPETGGEGVKTSTKHFQWKERR